MPGMRAVQISRAGGPLELVGRPIPEPAPGLARIKVQACGICHSDLTTKSGAFPGIAYPRVPGHEQIGIIDALGKDVPSRWTVGERVGVGWHAWHCGHCDACRRGEFFAGQTGVQISGVSIDGGYANYSFPNPGNSRPPGSRVTWTGQHNACAGAYNVLGIQFRTRPRKTDANFHQERRGDRQALARAVSGNAAKRHRAPRNRRVSA